MNLIDTQLRPTAPFDFNKTLAFIGAFPPPDEAQDIDQIEMTDAARIDGQTVAFSLRNLGTVEEPLIGVTLYADDYIDKQAALDRVRFFLSLDDDLTEFHKLAKKDKPFWKLVEEKLYGYHQVKFMTPFENAAWAILTQRASSEKAEGIKEEIIEAFTEPVEVDGETYSTFPAPDDIDKAPADIIGNKRKTGYFMNVVNAFQEVDEEWLRTAPFKEVKAWMNDIKGMGDWSALFVMLRGLGRVEKSLLTDEESTYSQSVLKAAQDVYSEMDFAALQEKAKSYGKWQGYWAHYLRVAESMDVVVEVT